MDEIIRAGAHCRFRCDELGCMHRGPHAGRMRRIARRFDDRFLRREIIARAMDEPHRDEIRLAGQLARNERSRAVFGSGLDDRRIAQIERRIVHHRDERSGHGHARRGFSLSRRIAHLEIPERSADVHYARNAAREPHLECRCQPRLVAFDLFCVRHPLVEVGGVRTRVQVSRLEEMHMAIDESRDNPFAPGIDDRCAFRYVSSDRRCDRADSVSGDDDRAVRLDGRGGFAFGMNDGRADNRRDPFL